MGLEQPLWLASPIRPAIETTRMVLERALPWG